jgi:hypothetical protein
VCKTLNERIAVHPPGVQAQHGARRSSVCWVFIATPPDQPSHVAWQPAVCPRTALCYCGRKPQPAELYDNTRASHHTTFPQVFAEAAVPYGRWVTKNSNTGRGCVGTAVSQRTHQHRGYTTRIFCVCAPCHRRSTGSFLTLKLEARGPESGSMPRKFSGQG